MTQVQKFAIALYVFLLLLCVFMVFAADLTGPLIRESLRTVSTEGFKTVLAALIGALSILLGGAR